MMYNLHTGSLVHFMIGHKAKVTCVKFSNDLEYIISASEDKTIKVWCVKTGKIK